MSLTLSTDRSSQGELPTMVAGRLPPSRPTVKLVPAFTTWWLVTMRPRLASSTQPVPRPRSCPSTSDSTLTVLAFALLMICCVESSLDPRVLTTATTPAMAAPAASTAMTTGAFDRPLALAPAVT